MRPNATPRNGSRSCSLSAPNRVESALLKPRHAGRSPCTQHPVDLGGRDSCLGQRLVERLDDRVERGGSVFLEVPTLDLLSDVDVRVVETEFRRLPVRELAFGRLDGLEKREAELVAEQGEEGDPF